MSCLLFVPATERRKLEKAVTLPCRGIVLDLEDAVAPGRKADARDGLAELARAVRGAGRELYVRVNGLHTESWREDVAAAVAAGAPALLVPKAESHEGIAELGAALDAAEQITGAARKTTLVLLIETARGVLAMERLLAGSPRVAAGCLGLADLSLDLGISWDAALRERPALYVEQRLRLSLASRAAGIEKPWDAVYMNIGDGAGFADDVRLGRRVGCQGKLVVHPSQIEPVNAAYRIGDDELKRAQRIVESFERAVERGSGALTVDGMLVDEPVVARARAVLATAEGVVNAPGASGGA
jgi:citrate lyase subunit beta/citryl-CoA lyase